MRIIAQIDQRQVAEIERKLGSFKSKAPNVIASALNRAATNVSANISKGVRKDYNLKASDIKETLTKERASRGNLSASVISRGKPLPLDRFKFSPKTPQPKRKAPIKVALKKGGLKKLLGAFVTDVHGTKIFKRTSKRRLPIQRMYGLSVPQMLSTPLATTIQEEGQRVFLDRVDRGVNNILMRGSQT